MFASHYMQSQWHHMTCSAIDKVQKQTYTIYFTSPDNTQEYGDRPPNRYKSIPKILEYVYPINQPKFPSSDKRNKPKPRT